MMDLLAVSITSVGAIAGIIGGAIGLIMLAGLVAGQFRRGVVDELRSSLDTANTEIAIERGRSDRLEGELAELRAQVELLRTENHTLRSVLTDERRWAQVVAETIGPERERVVEEVKEALGMQTARLVEHHERQAKAETELLAVMHELLNQIESREEE